MFRSINFKLLLVIISAFFCTIAGILFVADIRLTQIIDKSQEAVFKEKIDTLWHALERKQINLKKTGMIETYIEDFQESAIDSIRSGYYKTPDQPIFPFIIDHKGKIVMHPVYPKGVDAIVKMVLPESILTQKSGEFEHVLSGDKNWTIFRQFQEWGWIICYTIPVQIKYLDAETFNNTLAVIMGGVSCLVLIALSIVITRFTKPIVRLTALSAQIASGRLDQKIEIRGNDEIATLSMSFAKMRDAIKKQITALQSEKARVDNIIAGTNAGTWDWHLMTGELVVNERWAEIIGFNLEDLGRFNIDRWKETIHPEDQEQVEMQINRHFNKKSDYFNSEYRQEHKSGEWIWVSTHGKVVERASDDSPVRMSGTHLDITENKKNEMEKDALENQLRQAQKMEAVGRLAGGVAHDFNNMLGVILGQAEIGLDDLDPDDPLSDRLKEIKRAGERSTDLTRQLLAFARKQTVSPIVLDLNKTVSGMTKMLQRLIGEDIDLAWLPFNTVLKTKIDPGQIDQILANLCVNARDAIADIGKITIETGCSIFDEEYCASHLGFQPGRYVFITVSDNGCGMDSETLDFIFEPFFTTKQSGKGTGLGLATVYGIVKQNNGFINVYSEVEHGTTFKIYLPEHTGEVGDVSDKSLNHQDVLGNETILLVEDEPSILQMTQVMLEKLGYHVISVNSPGEALTLAKEYNKEIHILLTDVVMPEMNGRDLAETISSLYPNIECLFMSGYTSDVIARHGVLNKGVNFIAKPFSRKSLGGKIREITDRIKDKANGHFTGEG